MSNKVLYFEGAGCVPRGDVENCRIRTAFCNDKGDHIYLELSGMEVTKNSPEIFKRFTNAAFIDHCHYITGGTDDENYNRHKCERKVNFEYCKQGILNFVNTHLNCSFESIVITDTFDGYHVHGKNRSYNFMEEFAYNPERAEKSRKAFEKIDLEIREKLGEKYSKISLYSLGDSAITVRCYASDESMLKHGLDPKKRLMTIMI